MIIQVTEQSDVTCGMLLRSIMSADQSYALSSLSLTSSNTHEY